MTSNGYRLLGLLVWKGGRWYVRRALRGKLPSRRLALAGAAGVALVAAGALALAGRRGDS